MSNYFDEVPPPGDDLFPDEFPNEFPDLFTTDPNPASSTTPAADPSPDGTPPEDPIGPASQARPDIRTELETVWFEVAAAAVNSGLPQHRAADLVMQMRSLTVLYKVLGERAEPLQAALSHIAAVLGDMAAGSVWLGSLGLTSQSSRLAHDTRRVVDRVVNTTATVNPEARLAGLSARARQEHSRRQALNLSSVIERGAAPERLAEAHAAVVVAPPTALDEGMSHASNASASDLFADADTGSDVTLSSGFASLDAALSTRPEFPRGFVRAGQLVTIVAPSGSGKSSFINTALPAMIADSVTQGHQGRVMFVHVEDETRDLLDAMGIAPGRRYESFGEHLTVIRSTSREEVVKHLYREILWAKNRALETGLPVSAFIPPAVVVDYVQALTSPDDHSEAQGTARSADLLLYGIANLDPIALRTHGGVDFASFTGEAWPSGLESTSIAVVATAQLLLKGTAAQTPFDPNKSDWRLYAPADAHDQPVWTPNAGDAQLSRLEDIRGSSVLVQHSTTVVALFRARPRNNPEVGVDEDGFPTLADTRAAFLILKARFGQRVPVVTLSFTRQRNGGSKTQFVDIAAERALQRSDRFALNTDVFQQSGDPMIPCRPARTAMTDVVYT